jgi:hypothetical protein
MIKQTLLLWLAVALTASPSPAQSGGLSPQAQFSVVTCGPGRDLYATFGHSAFRLRDPQRGIDWVYNYGTFDFNTPNFYVKFARGRLPYALSKQRFEDFLYTYQYENRWVKEQLLDLDAGQAAALFEFLEENHRPENRFYQYDFLFENCATKVPEILARVLNPSLQYSYGHLQEPLTFRQLIHKNLERNSWSALGIDLALGSVIDREARGPEFSFLPQYVKQQIGHAALGDTPLVKKERTILDLNLPPLPSYFTATPLFWMLLLLLATGTITWIDYRNQVRSRVLDFLLFFLTGASGLLIAFLWFFTDHQATQWNANLLWAFPLNLIAAFTLGFGKRVPTWFAPYLLAMAVLVAACLLLWLGKVQSFSPLLLPVWAALLLRYAYLYTTLKNRP